MNMNKFSAEKLVLLAFLVASFAVSFHPKREVFPIFDWALFAQAPKSFPYKMIFVSSPECDYERVPLFRINQEGLTNLQNMFLREPSLFEDDSMKIHFFQQLRMYCDRLKNVKVELTQIRVDPLIFYRSGTYGDLTEIIKTLNISND